MKTVLVTLVSGIFVSLLTASGAKEDIELLNQHEQPTENFEFEEEIYNDDILFEDIFGKLEENKQVKIEDINVYEIEEEVTLDFDTKDYLPSDFNPYLGMNSKEEDEFEAKIAFETVFGKPEAAKEIIKIEDINVYEIEEELTLDFDKKNYLPTGFNPYLGMNSKEENEFETKIAFEG